ncbi:MAG: tetratricopeptide repeat protein [Planctomycetota bacterium]
MRRAILALVVLASPLFADGGLGSCVEGIDAIERGQYDAAVVALSAAIQAEPENADFYTARGVAYALSERVAEARKDLERSLKLRPQHDETRMWMASVVAMAGGFGMDTQHYPFATHDPYESFVRNWTKEYGWPAWEASQGKVSDRAKGQRAAALAKFPEIARQFASRRKAQPEMGRALLDRANALCTQGKYAEALQSILPVLERYPEDADVVYVHANALLGVGAPEGAREEYTRVLTWNVNHANAYLGRALAAATLGDDARAKSDLEAAARLDSNATDAYRPNVDRALAAVSRDGRTNAELFTELGGKGQSEWDDLVAAASKVRSAVAARRRVWAETYQDRLRELTWARTASPHDPSRMAELGDFLQKNADVLGERVEPRGSYRTYRYTNDGVRARELALAGQLLDKALSIDPDHVRALAARAALDIRFGLWGDAETRLRRAIDLGGDIPEVLSLFAEVLEHAAVMKQAAASDLRSVDTWSTWEYIYWRYPSQAELDQAEEYERQAQKLLEYAVKVIEAALAKCEGTAQGCYLKGLLLWRTGDAAGAKQALIESIRLAPESFDAHKLLATVHSQLGEHAEGLRERMVSTNLIETSAAPYLAAVWAQVRTTRWDGARKTLDAAAAFDPTDPRIAAYFGVVALSEGKHADATGWFRVALALDEAHAKERGYSILPDSSGTLGPEPLGLALAVSRKNAEALLAQGKADDAIRLAGYCLGYEKRVSQWHYASEAASAMLPDANVESDVIPESDNLMGLLLWNRVALGSMLVQAKRWQDAVGVLLPVEQVGTEQMVNGVGMDRLRKVQVHAAAHLTTAYLGLGDIESARKWVSMVPHKRTGVGPSLDPNAELEELGTRLQAEVERRRKEGLERGDESKEGWHPADQEKVGEAFQKLADDIGLSSMQMQGDVADLEARTRDAVEMVLTPKSTRWRLDVVRALWRAAEAGRRPRAEIATVQAKAVEGLRALAVANGYPEADLATDLARDPGTIEKEMQQGRRERGQEPAPKDENEALLAKLCDELDIQFHRPGDHLTAKAEDLLFLSLQRCVRALGEDASEEGWADAVIEDLRMLSMEREQFGRDPQGQAKYDQALTKLKAIAVERGVPSERLEKELGNPNRRRYR